MNSLRWSVDSLVCCDGTFFAYGWVLHEGAEVSKLNLVIHFEDGSSESVAASTAQSRKDVADSFPDARYALHSGFLVYGGCRRNDTEISGYSLAGELANGETFELEVAESSVNWLDRSRTPNDATVLKNEIGSLLKRGIFLLKSREFSKLVRKARKRLGEVRATAVSDQSAIAKLLKPNERESVVLVIDHDMGGGANHYRERLVTEKIGDGSTVILFTYRVATLSYVLRIRNKRISKEFIISGCEFVSELARQIGICELIYNTAVSFPRPELIAKLLVDIKRIGDTKLILLVHDYFAVCPSQHLLNSAGKFCGVPSEVECDSCLSENQQAFATLFRSRNIVEWRQVWGKVIEAADTTTTFSYNSLDLLKRAYAALDLSRVEVKPHDDGRFRGRKLLKPDVSAPRIGIVGTISYQKGSEIVKELSREIVSRNTDVNITVIGTLEAFCDEKVVRQTGAFRSDELPGLIEKSGVNIMLFPSICPETFSYVVQELIDMDLPVACFDLGAPAERIRKYRKGLILPNCDPAGVLNELISFHKLIYSS